MLKNISFISHGELLEFVHFDYEKNHLVLRPFSFSQKPKGRSAILVHGYGGSAKDLRHLACFLKDELTIGVNNDQYSHVLFYQYNTLPTIKDIAVQFHKDLEEVHNTNQPLDVYGYSMGGLVSRYWIEQLKGGQFIQNLITFGTPHAGIPLGKYEKMISLLHGNIPLSFAIKDMLSVPSIKTNEDNLFLKNLNELPSEFVDKIHYYTIAGNSYRGFESFGGSIGHHLLRSIDPQMDGVVHVSSAHSPYLESKSFSWKENPNRRATFELNHLEIIGIPRESIPGVEKLPFLQLQKWASEWK